MNIEHIPSLPDINNYPMHYLSEFALEIRDSAALYKYGPYLTYKYNDKVLSMLSNSEHEFNSWNSIFRLLCEVSSMIHYIEDDHSISEYKAFLIQTFQRCQKYPFKHASLAIAIAKDYMEKIRERQYSNKMLESAMLNFAPIVTYTGTLRKPEVEEFVNSEILSNTVPIKDIIRACILDKDILPQIIKNCDIVDTIYQEDIKEYNLPEEIINAYREKDIVKLYYVLIYLYYDVTEEKRADVVSKIQEVSDVYDRLLTGEIIDVSSAMEAMTKLEDLAYKIKKDRH